jgi:hypothetical protein
MPILKWIIVLLAVLNFGYMAFDGSRALATGGYIRPKTGEYAGKLGPWTNAVSAIGINPEGNLMKTVFVLWGIVGLFFTYRFAVNPREGFTPLLVMDVLSLWYLYMGTFSCVLQVLLLLAYRYTKK